MKSLLRAAPAVLLFAATPALAAASGTESGFGWMAILFLFFGAVIIVFQAVPGMILFFSMVKTLFFPKMATPGVHTDRKD